MKEREYLTIGILAGMLIERANLTLDAALYVASNIVAYYVAMERDLDADEFPDLFISSLQDGIDQTNLMRRGLIDAAKASMEYHRSWINMILHRMSFDVSMVAKVLK